MNRIRTLYGIWNLDYFHPIDLGICFEHRSFTIISLDIFVALYPLVIMAILYAITVMHDSNWRIVVTILKPLKTLFTLFKILWNIRTSAISAFANYMFLSNSKFFSTCFDLLAPVQVCSVATVNTTCRWAAFYDPSLGYLSRAHLPYAGLAWAIFILFVLTPLLILVLYPLAFKVATEMELSHQVRIVAGFLQCPLFCGWSYCSRTVKCSITILSLAE